MAAVMQGYVISVRRVDDRQRPSATWRTTDDADLTAT
jgi:hypothetical protein